MLEFNGDLLIGGWAIRHLHGTLDDRSAESVGCWSGQFEVEPSQEDLLEVGRQYLLLLDDGRNAEVVVTQIHAEPDDKSVVCDFEPWSGHAVPR